MDSRARRFSLLAVALSVASSLSAEDIPNWTVPPYWGARPAGELSTMTDTSPGVAFVAMSPCRVFDTRNANGPYGGPRLLANTTRNFDIDSGPCTGIPTGVDAYSMNFGAILADGIGFVTIWPTGVTRPTVSSINTIPGYVLANAAIVPAGTNGSISVFPNTGMHLYGDINGYFTDQYNPGVSFHAVSSTVAPAILAENTSQVSGAFAIQAVITSTTAGGSSAAVRGINNNNSNNNGIGVWGSHAGAGWGVFGQSQTGLGVFGQTSGSIGIGVAGDSASTAANDAGVFGQGGGSLPIGTCIHCKAAGVHGRSSGGAGVLGLSHMSGGVVGIWTSLTGDEYSNSVGVLGYSNEIGVFAFHDIVKAGIVSFTEPHATDPTKKLTYVALEGNEVGTYFRGRGRFQNGLATINVPEDFRMVTQSEGLSIQVTPIGEMASVAVASIGLDRIVVHGSRNVEFFYTVNGIRRGYGDFDSVRQNDKDYIPASPDAVLPPDIRPEIRERLIRNGTYKPDGTVNIETARRLGWDKEWEKRNQKVAYSKSE
jgi:hypothetical protein